MKTILLIFLKLDLKNFTAEIHLLELCLVSSFQNSITEIIILVPTPLLISFLFLIMPL